MFVFCQLPLIAITERTKKWALKLNNKSCQNIFLDCTDRWMIFFRPFKLLNFWHFFHKQPHAPLGVTFHKTSTTVSKAFLLLFNDFKILIRFPVAGNATKSVEKLWSDLLTKLTVHCTKALIAEELHKRIQLWKLDPAPWKYFDENEVLTDFFLLNSFLVHSWLFLFDLFKKI